MYKSTFGRTDVGELQTRQMMMTTIAHALIYDLPLNKFWDSPKSKTGINTTDVNNIYKRKVSHLLRVWNMSQTMARPLDAQLFYTLAIYIRNSGIMKKVYGSVFLTLIWSITRPISVDLYTTCILVRVRIVRNIHKCAYIYVLWEVNHTGRIS